MSSYSRSQIGHRELYRFPAAQRSRADLLAHACQHGAGGLCERRLSFTDQKLGHFRTLEQFVNSGQEPVKIGFGDSCHPRYIIPQEFYLRTSA